MGSRDRKERAKAELKDRILTAARHIAVSEGFEALSMRRIADAVEYAPGTLYLYFKDRDDIAAHVCAIGLRQFLAFLQAAANSSDPVERLRRLSQAYVAFSVEEPETYRISLMTDHQYAEAVARATTPEVQEGIDAGFHAIGLFVRAFQDLDRACRLRRGLDSEVLTHTLWAGLHGIASLRLTFPHLEFPGWEETVSTFLDVFLAGSLRPIG